MAIKALNTVGGLSIGEVPITVIDSNGKVIPTSLDMAGLANLGPIGNVKITGGSSNQFIQTDGTGNLAFISLPVNDRIVNANSNVSIPVASGNILFGVNNIPNVLVVSNTAVVVKANFNVLGINGSSNVLVVSNSNVSITSNLNASSGTANLLFNPTGLNVAVGNASNIAVTSTGFNVFAGSSNVIINTTGFNATAYTSNLVLTTFGVNVAGNLNVAVSTSNLSLTPVGLSVVARNSNILLANNSFNLNVNTSNLLLANTSFNVNVGTSNLVLTTTGVNVAGNLNVASSTSNLTLTPVGLSVVANTSNLSLANTSFNVNVGTSKLSLTNTGLSVIGNFNVAGDSILSGNLTVTGNLTYVNVDTIKVTDPIIELGGGPNGQPLTTNDGKDRGTLLQYYTTRPVSAFIGWKNSEGNFIFGSNVTDSSGLITVNTYGNVVASRFLGNLSGNTVNANFVTSNLVTANYVNVSANTVTNNLKVNLSVTGNTANFSGNVNAQYYFGNGSQLTGIGDPATISNGTSNVTIPSLNGNITMSVAGTSNIVIVTTTGMNVAGTANITGNTNVGNLTTVNANITNVLTAYNANVTGNIAVTGNANVTGNLTTYNANVTGNIAVTGNANITGNLTTYNANVTGNIAVTGNANITGNTNVTSNTITNNLTVNLELSGNTANFTGNINSALNANLGNLVQANFINVVSNIQTSNINVANFVTSNLNPGTDLTFSLGNANYRWKDLYISDSTIYLGTQNISANTTAVIVGNDFGANSVYASNNITATGNIYVNLGNGNGYIYSNFANVESNLYVGANANIVNTLTAANIKDTNLANTQIVYANASNTLVSNANLTFDDTLSTLSIIGNANVSNTINSNNATILLDLNANTANFSGNINSALNANLGNLLKANYANISETITANIINTSGFTTNNLTVNLHFSGNTANFTGNITASANIITDNIVGIGSATGLSISAFGVDQSIYLTPTGTGNINASYARITSLGSPQNDFDATNKYYVDTVAQGLIVHTECYAATADTLDFYSGGTVSYYQPGPEGVGATLETTGTYILIDNADVTIVGTRILVKDETIDTWNGVYVYTSPTVLTRATDYDNSLDAVRGSYLFIQAGFNNENTSWVQTTIVVVIGNDPILFTQFSAAGTYQAGTGLTLTGSVFSVNEVQSQITAVGTLGNLLVSGNANVGNLIAIGDITTTVGNIISGNASLGNAALANYFVGDGSLLTNITIPLANSIENGYSNVSIPDVNGNIHLVVSGTTVINVAQTNVEIEANINANGSFVANGNITANVDMFANGNITTNGNAIFNSMNDGEITLTYDPISNASIVTIGLYGRSIDANSDIVFHSSANLIAYDSKISASGGNTLIGSGNINVEAYNTTFIGNSVVGNNFQANQIFIGNTIIYSANTSTSTTDTTTIAEYTLTGTDIVGVEFFVKSYDFSGAKYSMSKVHAVTDGSAVDYTTFGTVTLGSATGLLSVVTGTGIIALQTTPASSNTTVWTTQYRLI
jgi:hypothetical protein